jgi:hypothetical protein
VGGADINYNKPNSYNISEVHPDHRISHSLFFCESSGSASSRTAELCTDTSYTRAKRQERTSVYFYSEVSARYECAVPGGRG